MRGWFTAARVAKPKGLDGRLRLIEASAFLRSAHVGDKVAFVPPVVDAPRFAYLKGIEALDGDGCIALFEGIRSLEAAQMLSGRWLLLHAEECGGHDVRADEASIVGFAVRDRALGIIGDVASVDLHRMQPLICVRRHDAAESEALIPFVDDIVCKVDADVQEVLVDLPAGLLEL